MEEQIYLFNGRNYLFMLGLKLIHVSKRGPWMATNHMCDCRERRRQNHRHTGPGDRACHYGHTACPETEDRGYPLHHGVLKDNQ